MFSYLLTKEKKKEKMIVLLMISCDIHSCSTTIPVRMSEHEVNQSKKNTMTTSIVTSKVGVDGTSVDTERVPSDLY